MMFLTREEELMLSGGQGKATRKAMEILLALGTIYGAERLVPITSVQISGVSYDNLGEAGLAFLSEMADNGGKVRVLTTLNPAGIDIESWEKLGIEFNFAKNQQLIINAYQRMGVIPTCSCTPYLFGNVPHFGEHISWAESSAVCYANSVFGARTNREGGPSALASALTRRTPAYGLHLDEFRRPGLTVHVMDNISGTRDFGALGILIGKWIDAKRTKIIPFIKGIPQTSVDELKALCASIATYGGLALFHMEGITPESNLYQAPDEQITVTQNDIDLTVLSLNEQFSSSEVDFCNLGCPHLSLAEIAKIAEMLAGKQVKKTFWLTTSRPTKRLSDQAGYTSTIEAAGAVFAVDTCAIVAPIRDRFSVIATDSAKACYYAAAKHGFKTQYLSFEEVISEALQ
jgi:predicted aconitase